MCVYSRGLPKQLQPKLPECSSGAQNGNDVASRTSEHSAPSCDENTKLQLDNANRYSNHLFYMGIQ